MDERFISKNIKTLRIKKKITLEELEKLTNLTKGYLSKIERSEKSPPLSTLNRIGLALGTDITFLLKENTEKLKEKKLTIVRNNQGEKIVTKGSLYGYGYEALANDKPGKNMEPFIILPASIEKVVFKHEGEEFMYTLEGKHEFIYGKKKYILKKGDSVYFDSGVPHSGRSIGGKAKVLAVMFSYKR